MTSTPQQNAQTEPKQDKSLLKCSQTKPEGKVVQDNKYPGRLATKDAPADMPKKSRKKFGRPTKYKPIYCHQIIKFFSREHTYEAEVTHTNRKGESWTSYQTKANPVPLMIDFAQWLGVDISTLWLWTKKHSDFSKATTHAQELQLQHLATVAGLGLYNANWAVFMAKNISEWRDKKDIEHSGTIDSNLFIDSMVGKAEEAERDYEDVKSRLN
jgi:hypothetical protein